MRKKLLITLGLFVAIAGIFSVVVAMQPSDYRITRSARINASPDVVFAQVNDFHAWEAWSPWAKLDPAAKNTFEGPSSGTGAIFKWSGNDEVGEGSMKITDSQPPERILIKLDFVRPMADTSVTEFTFKPEGNETVVTWTMSGQRNFMCRGVCMFMDMDKMLGDCFDEGLANMKKVVEKTAL